MPIWDDEDDVDLYDRPEDLNKYWEDDEDPDWEEKETIIMNNERIEKLTPLVTSQESIQDKVTEINNTIKELNAKKVELERDRIKNVQEINALLSDNECFAGVTHSFTRLGGSLYITKLVK